MAIKFVPATSTRRPSPWTTSAASSRRARRRADRRDQLPPGAEREDARARAARASRPSRRSCSSSAQRRAREPALRPAHRRAADVLGRGLRGDHRLRLADGRRVHQPAVPAERARLLDARGGRRDPPRRHLHGARRAALGEARAGERLPPDAPDGAGAPAPRLRRDVPVLEGGHLLLGGRDPVRAARRRGRALGHAVVELAHGLGAGDARRHGLGHGRPAARPRRRADDVDLRRAAHGGLRVGDGHGDRRVARTSRTAPRAQLQLSYASAENLAAHHPAVREPDHGCRASRRSSTATSGRTWPRWSRS